MSDTRCRAGQRWDCSWRYSSGVGSKLTTCSFVFSNCVFFLLLNGIINLQTSRCIHLTANTTSCCSMMHFSNWLVIYLYFLSAQALIASHSSLNCSRLPSSVSVSFISSRCSIVQKNGGPLEPVERNSNPIRLEQCSPPQTSPSPR